MSLLSLKCVVKGGRGRVICVVSLDEGGVYAFSFTSPSVFSFSRNSGEILNWHRDNIISLITQFNIQGITVRKIERDSFKGRPDNSDIFKLYMEGVMLSLAGSLGITNKHFYKRDIINVLGDENIFEKNHEEILESFGMKNCIGEVPTTEKASIVELVCALITLEKLLP